MTQTLPKLPLVRDMVRFVERATLVVSSDTVVMREGIEGAGQQGLMSRTEGYCADPRLVVH